MTGYGQLDNDLSSVAEELISRLRRHAAVLSISAPHPADVVAAADAVGAAADQYSSTVFERTGWGSPFTLAPDDEELDPQDGDGDEVISVPRLHVSAEYVLDVTSEAELRRLVSAKELVVEILPGESEGTIVDLVAALFAADGWNPAQYDNRAIHGELVEWSVDPT